MESDYKLKTWRDNIESLFQLITLSTILFIFGNYSDTYPSIEVFVLIILIPIVFEITVSGYNIQSLNELSEWGTEERIINFSFIILLFIIFIAHVIIAKDKEIIIPFIGTSVFIFIIITTLFVTSKIKDSKKGSFRLHYWMLAWMLAFFTRFPGSNWSKLGSGLLIGLMVHSFAVNKDNFTFYNCLEDSTIRCNGAKVCNPVNQINLEDYSNSNWYSITIISSLILLIFIFFNV